MLRRAQARRSASGRVPATAHRARDGRPRLACIRTVFYGARCGLTRMTASKPRFSVRACSPQVPPLSPPLRRKPSASNRSLGAGVIRGCLSSTRTRRSASRSPPRCDSPATRSRSVPDHPGAGSARSPGRKGARPLTMPISSSAAWATSARRPSEVLRELRTRYPGIPLVVEAPSEASADLRELLDGCEQLPTPATPEQIVDAVRRLLGPPNEEAAGGA